MLARNMLAAIGTFRLQQEILVILRLAGPSTCRELLAYCARRVPVMTQKRLRRLLTQMRAAHALTVYPTYRVTGEVFWALPGQPKPKPKRQAVPARLPTSGAKAEDRPRVSWWIGMSREAFQQACAERWA